MSYARKMAERAVKDALFKQVVDNVPMEDVAEWLYEDFGVKVGRRTWDNYRRAVLKNSDVKPQDIAILLLDHDIQPNEGAWDVQPRRNLPSSTGNK
ncbi:MAG: hypothetical protein GSR76_01180 [Desulfurococcales archaeon]|nr:hypothetical protein [Desulfurococcales archaeon]